MERPALAGLDAKEVDWRDWTRNGPLGSKWHGLAGKDRCVMPWKALEWHGSAGTEWRMQVGGERLGRVGIAVAGQERRGMARFGMVRRRLAGMEKPVKSRGMEGSGTVGIVEAWQARSVLVGRGLEGKVTQARCVKEARRKVMQGESRQARCEQDRLGESRGGALRSGKAGTESRGTERIGLMGHGNAGRV